MPLLTAEYLGERKEKFRKTKHFVRHNKLQASMSLGETDKQKELWFQVHNERLEEYQHRKEEVLERERQRLQEKIDKEDEVLQVTSPPFLLDLPLTLTRCLACR